MIQRMREFFKGEMWDGMNPAEQNRLIRLLVPKNHRQQDSLEFEFTNKRREIHHGEHGK